MLFFEGFDFLFVDWDMMLTSIMSSSIVGASEAAVIIDCVESRVAFEPRAFFERVFFFEAFSTERAKTKKEQSDERRWCSSLPGVSIRTT